MPAPQLPLSLPFSPLAGGGLVGIVPVTAGSAVISGVAGPGSAYYRAAQLALNPTAYFRLNEAAGGFSVADSSPNAYSGSVSSTGVTLGNPSMLAGDASGGGAALLDGLTGQIITNYQTTAGLNALSISFWYAYEGGSQYATLPRLLCTDAVAADKAGYEVYLAGPQAGQALTVAVSDGSTVYTVSSGLGGNLPVFVRQHVVITYDGHILRFYLNGIQVGTTTVSAGPIVYLAPARNPLRLGNVVGGGSQNFNGYLQDVAILEGVALSAAQVQTLYQAGNRGAATQQAAASRYAFKQQVVKVLSPSEVYIDTWRDAPLLDGVKFALNSATTPLRVTLPRKFDNFDEAGAPGARGSIAQGNIVQYWLFGPRLPTSGLLKFQGVIDGYAPQISDSGEESVTVTITPFDSAVGDHGLLGSQTFGTPNVAASYQDPVALFNWWFNNNDPLTGHPYTYPLTADPANPTTSGNSVQYTFSAQPLNSIYDTILRMLPANWYWKPNQNKTLSLNVPPVTAQHTFVLGQHIVAPSYKKDWTRLKNVVQVVGNGLTTALTTALNNGTVYTALAVGALPVALAVGQTLTINASGNPSQTVTVAAAAAQGATSVTVTSFTANGTYPVQTQVTIYVAATVSGSDLATYGKRAMQLADNRVVDQATATTLANSLLAQYDRMILRTTLRIVDYRGDANWGLGYDIETLLPGDTVQIINPANEASATLWDVAQWDASYWDYVPSATLQQVAIIFDVTYHFDSVDISLGWFSPDISRDVIAIRTRFQDYSLG